MSRLYKKFVTERVSKLVDSPERIRLCTVIAHIDHGKTTLTDSLIAASGLLSKDVAARARLMDYDLIEQERGITIKASSISLIHSMNEEEYLVHLIDTPGHIDFSSHVTRGLRLTDGALVVVDAIEGIMVQTETVTRQAAYELVRPCLFVNKVDRLITERRLRRDKVASEVQRVVREFNAMLGKYLEADLLDRWEISFRRGSLTIGSALDKWGIGIETLLQRTDGRDSPRDLAEAFLSVLDDILSAYYAGDERRLQDRFPIAPVVLNSLVRTTPSPVEAQSYRVPRFWSPECDESVYAALRTCNPAGPCVVVVADVRPDRHAGTVSTGRVFSGTLNRAAPLRNLRTGRVSKTLQVGITMSKIRVALDTVPCGSLAFLTGLKDIAIGDTLVDASVERAAPMMGLQYPTEPVVTYTVEPRVLKDLSKIQQPIAEFAACDPALEFSVNPETGEMLLSGAGELHVEIAVEKLSHQGVDVVLGRPMVLLKEQMTHDGEAVTRGGPPASEFTARAILTPEDYLPDAEDVVLAAQRHSLNYLIDRTRTVNPHSEEAQWIREAFSALIRNGPVAGERMRRVTIEILRADIRAAGPETSWRDVTQPLLDAARESVITGEPVLLEPWMHLEITMPEEYVGEVTSVLARRKGRVLSIETERGLYKVEAEIPVRESFGLANELRTATSGWATWGARPGEYRPVTHSESQRRI